jgi:S-adenosylhomocysteine hydrolase
MRVMAIADLDNDKLNDLVTVNNLGTEISVRYYKPDVKQYVKGEHPIVLDANQQVTSVLVTKSRSLLQGLLLVVENTSNGETTLKQYS